MAQGEIAVLMHNGEISAYYGKDALFYAEENAEDGDIITLSNGKFEAYNFIKSITFRGVGTENVKDRNQPATTIYDYKEKDRTSHIGQLLSDIHAKTMVFEGICFDHCDLGIVCGDPESVTFNKCSIINTGCPLATGSSPAHHLILNNCDIWNTDEYSCPLYASKELTVNNCFYQGFGATGLYEVSFDGNLDILKVNISNSIITTNHLTNSSIQNSYVYVNFSSIMEFGGNWVTGYLHTNADEESLKFLTEGNTIEAQIVCENDFNPIQSWTRENYLDKGRELAKWNVGIFCGEEPYSTQIKMQRIVNCSIDKSSKNFKNLHVDIEVEDIADPTFHKFTNDQTKMVYIIDGKHGGICKGTSSNDINYDFEIDTTDLEYGDHTMYVVLTDGNYTTANQKITFTIPRKKGDVNGDGEVDTSDINEIINYLLGKSTVTDTTILDVNNDGVVNIADIVSIVSIIHSLEDTQDTHDERFDDVVPQEWQSKLTNHMPIYSGMNPPNVEGVYLMHPMIATYCSWRDAGWEAVEEVFRLSNQNIEDNTIDCESYESYSGNLIHYSIGNGTFISGEGNNFTIFFIMESQSQALSKAISASIISGTKTAEGIVNMHFAKMMLEMEIKPDAEYNGMGIGDVNIFHDSDGLSENTIWNKPSTRSIDTSPVTTEDLYDIYGMKWSSAK